MMYLREAQAEVIRSRIRAFLAAVTEQMEKVAAAFRRAAAVLADAMVEVVRSWRPLLVRLGRWWPEVRALQYGYTGPALTGPQLAHWRRHAGTGRRRQR